jgi:hypothetical protein
MKALKILRGAALILLLVSASAAVGDFDWMHDFNIPKDKGNKGNGKGKHKGLQAQIRP